MSTSALMNLGTRAMLAAQAQMSTTGHNISNAAVPGYSRQETQLTTTDGQYTGAGFFGRGVTVETVKRAVNAFLTNEAAQTKAAAASDQARLDKLKLLEGSIGTGQTGLGQAASQLLNAFADVANHPSDLSARQVVLSRAQELASQFRSTSDQLESLQASVKADIGINVKSVNELAKQIAEVNLKIASAGGSVHTPNDLLDQRDQLVSQISQYVEVTRLEQGDGSLSLFVGGGQSLVLGSVSYELKTVDNEFDPSRVGVAINVAGEIRNLSTDSLGGGAISGLLKFQDHDLASMRGQLGRLAATLADAVNQRQGLGLDLTGGAGVGLFRFGDQGTALPALVLPASSNAKDGSGNHLASLSISVSNPAALQASEYELINDPNSPGQYRLTRLSDGVQTDGINDGDTVDGFTLHITTPPQPGDRFLLQPVSTAAQTLGVNLSDPRGIAAANPLTVIAGAANKGTLAASTLTMVATPAAPYGAMTLVFPNASPNTNDYELRDSGGNVLSSGTFRPGSSIDYDGFKLTLTGSPAQGDTLAINLTTDVRSSNGNALAAVNIGSKLLTGDATFTDTFASMLADLGTRTQGATAAATASAAIASRADGALSAEVGVNLDEEAARLLQYQQSYQAAAKILQVAQKIFDSILSLGA